MGEGPVLEAATGQSGSRRNLLAQDRRGHKQVIVPRIRVNMARFPLDQIAQDIVGHPAAQRSHPGSAVHDGIDEQQSHFIVKRGGAGSDLDG
ncbi:hypothetical protein D3C75_1149280 [compost metagenome]